MAIQSNTFTAGGSQDVKGYTINLSLVEESTSIASNTSVVSYRFTIKKGPNYGFFTGPYFNWDIFINSQRIAIRNFAFNVRESTQKEQLIVSGKLTVNHNSDGSMDMPFDVSVPNTQEVSSYGPPEIRLKGSWKLTTIPLASSISATNTDIGGQSIISIYSASRTFTHTVTYKLQGKDSFSGTIADKTSLTTIQFPMPETLYAEITDSKYGVISLTCYTYSGGVQVGKETTTTFRVYAAESICKPTIEDELLTITDSTTLALTDGQAIRYISTIKATARFESRNQASIKKVLINGTEAQKQPDGRYQVVFERAAAWKYDFEVWDSRGYYTTVSKEILMHDYIPFSCNPTVERITPTSATVRIYINGNFWAKQFSYANKNEILLKCKFRKQGTLSWSDERTISPQINEKSNTYTASLDITGGEKDYESVFEWEIYGQDRAMHLTYNLILSMGLPVCNWWKNGFNFNVPLFFMNHEMDFVVDAGVSGIWSYRKWYSGKAECWGLASKTVTNWGSNEWGGVYNCANVSLPFGFVEVSVALANVASGTTYAPAYGDPAEILGTGVATFNCNLPGTGSKSFKTSMLVVGRWK